MSQETINQFLDRPDVILAIKEANLKKKHILKKMLVVTFLFIIPIVFILYFSPELRKIFLHDGKGWEFIPQGVLLFIVIYFWLTKELNPRHTVMSKLAPLIDQNLFYEFKPSHFPEWINDERLVGKYDQIDNVCNHIKYTTIKTKGVYTSDVLVEGFEVTTMKKNIKGKLVTACHAFITEIRFSGNQFHLNSEVVVKTEGKQLVSGFQDLSFLRKDTKVVLESNDFEKMFDVESKDQIEARDLLNPHTMYALMHFKTSLSYTRNYTFLFSGNSIFLKYYIDSYESPTDKKLKWYQFSGHSSSVFGDNPLLQIFQNKRKIYNEFYEEFLRFKNFVEDFDPFYRT